MVGQSRSGRKRGGDSQSSIDEGSIASPKKKKNQRGPRSTPSPKKKTSSSAKGESLTNGAEKQKGKSVGNGEGEEIKRAEENLHPLFFKSIKRSRDMFLSDYNLPHRAPSETDPESQKSKVVCKIRGEYAYAANPELFGRENGVSEDPKEASEPGSTGGGNMVNEEIINAVADKIIVKNRENTALALVAGGEGKKGESFLSSTKMGSSGAAVSKALAVRHMPKVPKPKWHAPWKLMRVISGHLGWVRSIAVDATNEWFATGSNDRTVKIWDLASGSLKLTLTGHISPVRGLAVSPRHPYLFSVGEDKMVKCWDLEQNKVVRHYHGHLSAVYTVDLHPMLDILVTGGRDSVARVWDMRTKAAIHTLSGHQGTVQAVKCQSADPQVITASADSCVRLWDLAAGRTMVTLTNHKKGVRALALHPKEFTFASAAPGSIKQWKCPRGDFLQNIRGHNTVLNALALNSDNVLVSGGDNGTMQFHDWKSGYTFQKYDCISQPGTLDSESGVMAMTFDMSGSRLITGEGDKTIKVFKEDDTATEETHPIQWNASIAAEHYRQNKY
eukprot:Nk52_evm25s805 gene=Nk52_evmTU25s805